MNEQKNKLLDNGFMVFKKYFDLAEINLLNNEYDIFIDKARKILGQTNTEKVSLSDFYKNHPESLIVVPEINNPSEPCRFEFIAQSSITIKSHIIKKIALTIKTIMGSSFVLFKDKCNIKSSGGGAFPAHQDISAYKHFQPNYFLTSAVLLDNASIQNGCLEMAINYKNNLPSLTKYLNSPFGSLPLLDCYEGGEHNGDIKKEISANFSWQTIEAEVGDIILFDSYIPHRSQKNMSSDSRRIFFFTFNLEEDGDHYRHYYDVKREKFNDPIFHVSTPTRHDSYTVGEQQ